MKVKYFYQLLGSHLSIIIVALMILSLLFTHYAENVVYENKVDELSSYGQKILHDFEQPQLSRQQLYLEQYSDVLSARNILFTVFDRQGKVLYPLVADLPVKLTEEEWEQLQAGQTVFVKRDLQRYEQDVSLVALPYIKNGIHFGGILLAAPISGTEQLISQLNRMLFYTVLVALFISLLLSWFLSSIHVKRIKKIRTAAKMVATGDYQVQLPSSSFDEIGELAGEFNEMVQQLKRSSEEIVVLENRRRQFIADVSHELRTPLTTISGLIEGINNDMIPPEEQERSVQLINKETNRLIRLVNENLDYEKIRSNQVVLEKEMIQLTEVFEIIKELVLLQAEEVNTEIVIDVSEDVFVYADYDRLIQILMNTAKNSIQFTENGTIYLIGYHEEKNTIIEIKDTGIGMDRDEVEAMWQRFYKADLSRKNTPYGEFGLGLSIVKQLVVLHNGEITVQSKKNHGTSFVIKLPLPTSPDNR